MAVDLLPRGDLSAKWEALDESQFLDAPPSENFDRLTRLLARLLKVPASTITLIDGDRQFFLSSHGLKSELAESRETPLSYSICKYVVASNAPLIINDARIHPLVQNEPATTEGGFVSYLGVPLTTKEGRCLGAFCAIGFEARIWSSEDLETASDLAKAVLSEFRIRADEVLRAESIRNLNLLGKALDAALDVVLITEAEPIDEPGPRIVYINDAFTRMTGYSREEVIGKTPRILQGPKTDRATLDYLKKQLRKWKHVRVELLNYRKDGSEFWSELDIQPVADASGWYTHWISIQRDVDGRKAGEKLTAEAKAEAEMANLAKSQFLANMSHEIRTPMSAILGFVDMLREPNVGSEDRDEMLKTIRRSGNHLMTILNDILDLSRIEAGKMEMDPIVYPPWQVALEVVSSLSILAVESGVSIQVRPVGKIPARLVMDPTRVRQILMNLVGNAIKFSKPGGVVSIRLQAEPEGSHTAKLTIEVEDHGIGMTPEQRKNLFQPFEQGDKATTRRYGGAGLGLSICRRLLAAMQGEIDIESTSGVGSLFTVKMPLDLATAKEPWLDEEALRNYDLNPTQGPPSSSIGRLSGRILIAEDSPEILKILTYHLNKTGLVVETAANGRIAMAKSLEKPYDLILMDMQMPELDGYGAAKALRRSGYTGPIIALTAHAMREDRERCLAAGCSAYLTKPINPRILLEEIARFVCRQPTV